jgi:hypothetical protein
VAIDIKVDGSRELVIVNGDLVLIDGGEALTQKLSIKLKTVLGEWFIDVSYGVDYFGYIWVKNPDLTIVESLLKSAILEEPGVRELATFSMVYNQQLRSLTVSFSVITDFGTLSLSQGV